MAGTAGRTDSRIVGTSPPPQLSPRALPCGRARGPYCAPSGGRRLPFGCPLTPKMGTGHSASHPHFCLPACGRLSRDTYIICKVGKPTAPFVAPGAMLSCPPARPRTRLRGTHPHVLLSCSQTVPMPQMSADSAGAGVELKLEPKDRLISCRKCGKPLDFLCGMV